MNRSERRRRGHRRHGGLHQVNVPVLPGVVPDMTEASQQTAMEQAHEDLPAIPGTRVVVRFYAVDAGLEKLTELGYRPEQLQLLTDHINTAAGDDPHIVIATRETS